MDKYSLLRSVFGHSTFRPGQETMIDALCAGRDALGVMPTGAGKSVCYQIPALLSHGITLVISPLISLMKDQVYALTRNGVDAAYINSSLNPTQEARVRELFRMGQYKIVYVAPERLALPDFVYDCRQLPIDLVAVDEAHCVSQWGQDFRPGYLAIADFLNALPIRPTVGAFTATATETVKADIVRLLGLQNPVRVTTGFDRPNLYFEVRHPKNKDTEVLALVQERRERSGIVYCSTRKSVEKVCALLESKGLSVTRYHAGLSDAERRKNQEDFINDRARLMVATNAFGMGIDKSDVSFVIHYHMPKDMESYYQEAGRAGRDGEAAECFLLYAPGDVTTNLYFIRQAQEIEGVTPQEQEALRRRNLDRLARMKHYCLSTACLRHEILAYFGEESPADCGNCGNCCADTEVVDVTTDAQKILSCVARLHEGYGGQMVTDVLRGSKGERILSLGFDKLSTYGLMADRAQKEIRDLIDYLVLSDYLSEEDGQYPILHLTPSSKEVLFAGATVTVRRTIASAKSKKEKTVHGQAPWSSADDLLWAALREKRNEIAQKEKVPPYVIFSNATLRAMCVAKPVGLGRMRAIPGIGDKKLERYGQIFLDVIRPYAPTQEPDEPMQQDSTSGKKKKRSHALLRQPPQPMTEAEAAQVERSDDAVGIATVVGRINEVREAAGKVRITPATFNNGLTRLGFLSPVEVGKSKSKQATPAGVAEVGMKSHSVHAHGEDFIMTVYNRKAQDYVIAHESEILAAMQTQQPKEKKDD